MDSEAELEDDQQISFMLHPTDEDNFKGFDSENGYLEPSPFKEVTNYVLDTENDDDTRGFTSNDLISRTLHQLARDGNHKILSLAIDRLGPQLGPRRVNRLDNDKLAPLHYAARYAHPYTIKTLLQKNARVNIKGADGLTPLHCAARYRKAIDSAAKKRKHRMRLSRDETVSLISNEDNVTASDVEGSEIYEDDGVDPNELPPPPGSLNVYEDRMSVITLLVDNGADLDAVDIYGLTALHYAAMRGNDVAARDLLTYENVNIEAEDEQKMTPLTIAATYGYVDICRRLIDKGANLAHRDEIFQTALHRAAAEGHLEIAELLLNAAFDQKDGHTQITDFLSHKDAERQTALHVAVTNGHIEIVALLLEKGAKVNAVRDTLATTLHAAAVVGNIDLIRLLIKNGADVEAIDSNQQTPLHKAAANDHGEVIEILLENNANIEKRDINSFTPLLVAALNGHAVAIKALMQNGATVDCVDKDDRTSVFWCAKENHVEALMMLLEDPLCLELIDFSDRTDNSPLHEAVRKGNIECMRVLIDNGSQIDNKNEDAETALHIASEEGQVDVVRELTNRFRFLVNDENEDANTPLHLSSLKGHEDVVDLLLEAGADVEARNTALWTPLDCASANGHESVCSLLLEFDAPLDPLDKTKTTPLQLAAKNGHVDVTNLLLARGASVEVVDSSHRNALQLAISNGKKDSAMAIVKSDQWLLALRSVHFDDSGMKITPFRNLVVKFPEVALAVLDRCVTSNGLDADHREFGLRFNYEFLDDTYFIMNKDDDVVSNNGAINNDSPFNEEGHLHSEAEPYTQNQRMLKQNHPLMLMVKYRRSGLLGHPVSVSLVKQKWTNYARYVYYFNLIFYAIFLTFLTAYVVNAADWKYAIDVAMRSNSTVKSTDCKGLEELIEISPHNYFTFVGKWVVLVISFLHIIREIIQFYQARWSYIGVENLLEWVCYVGGILLVIDVTDDAYPECTLREPWQWQVGAVAIFLAWINLVLFLRKLPLFGIYVVMFTDVLMTFTRFFVVFFLFIVGFALSFYMVFRSQATFESVGKSLLKTSIMMIGEFEYDTIFNNESSPINYPIVSNILFVVFLVMMSILIMNLLVGLAVDDIKLVQEQAVLKRRAMQTQLIMDVEVLIPEAMRRKFARAEKLFYPHKKRMICSKLFSDFNNLYLFDYTEMENKSDQQEEMDRRLDDLTNQIMELKSQNQKMYNLFNTTLAFQRKNKSAPFQSNSDE